MCILFWMHFTFPVTTLRETREDPSWRWISRGPLNDGFYLFVYVNMCRDRVARRARGGGTPSKEREERADGSSWYIYGREKGALERTTNLMGSTRAVKCSHTPHVGCRLLRWSLSTAPFFLFILLKYHPGTPCPPVRIRRRRRDANDLRRSGAMCGVCVLLLRVVYVCRDCSANIEVARISGLYTPYR